MKELGQAVRRTAKGKLLSLVNKVSELNTAELQTDIKAVRWP